MLIVRLLCVIRMNCVCTLISLTSSVKRADVRLVQRRVDFVENAERAGRVLEDANQQCQRGQRLFAAREQQHVLQFLSREAKRPRRCRFQRCFPCPSAA